MASSQIGFPGSEAAIEDNPGFHHRARDGYRFLLTWAVSERGINSKLAMLCHYWIVIYTKASEVISRRIGGWLPCRGRGRRSVSGWAGRSPAGPYPRKNGSRPPSLEGGGSGRRGSGCPGVEGQGLWEDGSQDGKPGKNREGIMKRPIPLNSHPPGGGWRDARPSRAWWASSARDLRGGSASSRLSHTRA